MSVKALIDTLINLNLDREASDIGKPSDRNVKYREVPMFLVALSKYGNVTISSLTFEMGDTFHITLDTAPVVSLVIRKDHEDAWFLSVIEGFSYAPQVTLFNAYSLKTAMRCVGFVMAHLDALQCKPVICKQTLDLSSVVYTTPGGRQFYLGDGSMVWFDTESSRKQFPQRIVVEHFTESHRVKSFSEYPVGYKKWEQFVAFHVMELMFPHCHVNSLKLKNHTVGSNRRLGLKQNRLKLKNNDFASDGRRLKFKTGGR